MTMPGQDVSVDLNLDGNYVEGIQQATTATEGLANAVQTVQAPARGMQRALDLVTPTRAHLAAWAGFTAAAANWQGQTSQVRATAVAAGQSIKALEGDVQRMARTFPIGTSGAVEMVRAVQSLGASQKQVGPLAATMEKLSAATGSFGPQLATSFGQLNRQMGSLDPQRVQRFGDALTTLSAKSGASAQGIVDFSQAIAPVAQQAGIGVAGIMGISTAFVKLGNDGGAAATAVNKILGDLNRSVREGSNDMAAYAQITGMTVNQFKALFQANPAQALASVTTAIGKAGPQGQMALESLGLEGTRTQNALLQLSQSGGLQSTINQAVGATGNGSTEKASKEALGGLNDSLTMLRSTAGQTADALGGPFLHALTRIADVAKVALAPVNAVLGSGAGQHVIGALGGLALTGMAVRRVVKPLGTAALGFQAATSSPMRAIFGGYSVGAVGEEAAMAGATERTRTGRFGREAIQADMLGIGYGPKFLHPVTAGMYRAGITLGALRSDMAGGYLEPGQAPQGPGPINYLRRAARHGVTASSMAYEAWARSVADPYAMATTPTGARESLMNPREGQLFRRAGEARESAMKSAEKLDPDIGAVRKQMAGLKVSLGLIDKEGGRSASALARVASSTGMATKAMYTFAEKTAVAGTSALGGLFKGGLGLVGGGIGAGLLAGTVAYGAYKHSQQSKSAEQDRMYGLDMYSTLNSYRDSIGQAGVASKSLADSFNQASALLAKGTTSLAQARQVTPQDIAANVGKAPRKGAPTYVGSNEQIAGQIQSAVGYRGVIAPQDLATVKDDLLRQTNIDPSRVEDILGAVQAKPGQNLMSSTVAGLVGGVTSSAKSYKYSAAEQLSRDPLGVIAPGGDAWSVGGSGLGSKPLVGDTGKKTLDMLQGTIEQQFGDLSTQYNRGYAVQKSIRTANDAMQAALKGGHPDAVAAVAQRMGIALTGDKGFHVSAADVRSAGGDITKLVGDRDIYGMSADELKSAGVTSTGRGVRATLQESGAFVNLRAQGDQALLPFFAASQQTGAAGRAQHAVIGMSQAPQSGDAQVKAMNAMVDAAAKSGTSLTDLALQATKATSVTSDWEQALLASVAAEAQFRQTVLLQGANQPAQIAAAAQSDIKTINAGPGPGGSDSDQYKAYMGARDDLKEQRNNLLTYFQQRVMAQRQFQVNSRRAQEDYQRSVQRSEDAYHLSRQRSNRDFHIQLVRQEQDAAKTMYDPYQRIQVQPVYAAENLIGQEREQVQAMRGQIDNLKKLRRLGLTEQTIRQLSLYDPNKAQQVTELVADLSANQNEVGQLNNIASQRQNLAGQLLREDPTFQRQKADYKRQLADQQKDHHIQLFQMHQDYMTSQRRMSEDIRQQDLAITNNMKQLSRDMSDIIHGRFVHLRGQVHSILDGMLGDAKAIMPQINQVLHLGGSHGSTGGGSTGSTGITQSGGGQAGGGYGNVPVGGSAGTVGQIDTPGMHSTTGSTDAVNPDKYVRPGTGTVYGPRGSMTLASKGTLDQGATLGYDTAGGVNFAPPPSFQSKHPADPGWNKGIAKKMMPSWSHGLKWKAWQDLWEAESHWNQYSDNQGHEAYGIPQASPGNKMLTAGKDWRTNPATQILWGIHYIQGKYGDPLYIARTGPMGSDGKHHPLWDPGTTNVSASYKGYAYGGIATTPHLGMVAEKGTPEAMIPLNAHGAQFLWSAMSKYVGIAEAKLIGSGGLTKAMTVHISNDTYKIDQGQHIHGEVTVKANSPAEWATQARQSQRQKNLNSPRGVRWSRS